jgi:hypothetical protein
MALKSLIVGLLLSRTGLGNHPHETRVQSRGLTSVDLELHLELEIALGGVAAKIQLLWEVNPSRRYVETSDDVKFLPFRAWRPRRA